MARGLFDLFDSVIMLTWSDWPTEPRSNRYHYATRFARELPVYFVQCNGCGPEATFEKLAGHNIEIVRVPATYNFDHARNLIRTLSKRGARRPLLWIYNWWFEEFIRYSPSPFRVYHATEDYFSRSKMLSQLTEQDLDGLKRVV